MSASSKMASETGSVEFSQISHNIRTSTAQKLEIFNSIRGRDPNIPFWDIVVITALDKEQKEAYEAQLHAKIRRNELPTGSNYHVFYDPPGPKIGNGGSVLVTIGDLLGIYGAEKLSKCKILMLPAGGYSQRFPSASVLGKAFTALPIGEFYSIRLELGSNDVIYLLPVCLLFITKYLPTLEGFELMPIQNSCLSCLSQCLSVIEIVKKKP